jgi:4-hydroxybenzoate polyprenyltransferase
MQRTALTIARALVKAVRPNQSALKNLFVFAALVFTGNLFKPDKLLPTIAAFLLFSVVAGSIYLLNDLQDVEQDRQHPEKCRRPIASRELPENIAWLFCVVLAVGGLAGSFSLNVRFGLAALTYFLLQVAYCLRLKHMVLLDVFTIAAGFVLRTVAGALAIHVGISHWLLLCTLQLALFLGFGKRRQELTFLGAEAGNHRAILDEYSLPFLDQLINLVIGMTIVCYSVYSIESETAHQHPHLWITVPIVIYSLCRYMFLVYQKGMGGEPEKVLKRDPAMKIAVALWLIVVVLLFAFDHPGVPLLKLP